MNAACSWSGGKDSCFALMKATRQGCIPKVLLNVLNEAGKISRSHGIPLDILQAQGKATGLPVHTIASSWADYEANLTSVLKKLKSRYVLEAAVFGDIDLQAHRDWEEMVCANASLKAILPLWQQDREDLVFQMLESGIKTIIVSCNEKMGEKFLGKTLNNDLVQQLKHIDIDVCGENGEFHTLVLDCPLFSFPLKVEVSQPVKHENYWFCQPILL
jgi:uncharacterized protein (TIGR00290 family)